jgi:hypothetical protein
MIPIRIKSTGNAEACNNLVGFAKKQMFKLEEFMAFQNLKQGTASISPYRGALITCTKSFGLRTIEIYAQRGFVSQQKAYETHIYYFVRVKAPDHEQFPRDRDGYKGDHPEIAMDRIILCDLEFKGNKSTLGLLDPIDDTSNRNHNFTPGGGKVACDVDILNDIVYFPTNLTEDQNFSILAKVKKTAETMPSNANPSPVGCLRDIAADYFGFGGMSDPIRDATVGGYDEPASSVTYDLEYAYEVSGVTWPTMVTPPPSSGEAEVTDFYELYLSFWRADWSPLYGGFTSYYTDLYDFSNLPDVSSYYGTFNYKVDYPELQFTAIGSVHTSYNDPGEETTLYVYTARTSPFVPGEVTLTDGVFFAPKITATPSTSVPFNCLFAAKTSHVDGAYAEVFAGGYDPGSDSWFADTLFGSVVYIVTGDDTSISDIRTPLENVDVIEMMAESSTSTSPCSENPCFFGLGSVVEARWSLGFSDTGKIAATYLPCPAVGGYHPLAGYLFKNGTGSDTHRYVSFHAPDPTYLSYSGQKNFTSLFVFSEVREKRSQASCASTNGQYVVDSNICTCNGVEFTYEEFKNVANATSRSAVGVLIYIFAPKQLITTDPDTGVTEFTWDIHSARRDPNIINPYRCLGLEEYVNSALLEVQESLDNATTIPKTSDGMAYTLNYYGGSVSDGFVIKGRAEVKPK